MDDYDGKCKCVLNAINRDENNDDDDAKDKLDKGDYDSNENVKLDNDEDELS